MDNVELGLWGLLGGILALVGLRILVHGWRRLRRREVVLSEADDAVEEVGAPEFVDELLDVLEEQGILAEPVPETFALMVPGGHWLDLTADFATYAAAPSSARPKIVERVVARWDAEGWLLSEQRFLEQVAEALREAGFEARVDRGRMAVVLPHLTMELAAAWDEALEEGAAEVVARLVTRAQAHGEGPPTLEAASPHLFVEVLPLAQVSAEMLEALAGHDNPSVIDVEALRPQTVSLTPRLVARPALRQNGEVRDLAPYLTRWGVRAADAWALVADQLESGGAVPPWRGIGPGVLFAGWEDPRDAHALLLPYEAFGELGLEGVPLVWPLTPSRVFVAQADNENTLRAVFTQVESSLPVPAPLSLLPLIRREPEGPLEPLTLPEGHRLGRRLASLYCQQVASDYAMVHQGLDALSKRNQGLPPSPVRIEGSAAPSGERTVATWSAASLLPADVDEIEVVIPGLRFRIPPAQLNEMVEFELHWVEPHYFVATEPPSPQLLSWNPAAHAGADS